MKYIRYYAIGHSYLLHGPFDGWQTDGFWGMAASEPTKDYFHQFRAMLEKGLNAKVEAVAENHAGFERCCTKDATKEKYQASENYLHMCEVIQNFKPNVITIFVGGGNTIANDEKSLELFFNVLFEMVKKHKRDDAVVICVFAHKCAMPLKVVAEKFGFVVADCSVIHEKKDDKFPYCAYDDYPEYDEKVAMGAIEFRGHPGNKGHEKIASVLYESAKDEIVRKIQDGIFEEEYSFQKYVKKEKIEKFEIETIPKFRVNIDGFNIRQQKDRVIFSSAPDTGASLSTYGVCISGDYNRFFVEMAIDGAKSGEKLQLTLNTNKNTYIYNADILDDTMRKYIFDISDMQETIVGLCVKPEMTNCLIMVKSLGFEN